MVERGALLIDADAIAREVVEPGGPAYRPLVDRFGTAVLGPDKTLDRKALAAVVFHDSDELAALNAITHPVIRAVMDERRRAAEGTAHVVLLDIPLLEPAQRDAMSLDVIVVVDCPVEVAVERLVTERGFDRADAEARVAAQISRTERNEGADFVIDNSVDLAELVTQVEGLWAELVALELSRRGVT